MKKNIWYFDEFDFNEILCPYKMKDHLEGNPPNTYNKHDFLFMEQDLLKDILLIDCGQVKVGCYDEEGNEQIIAYLGRGEILGQMALLGETRHGTFAEVMEDGTQVCKMSVHKAQELTRDYVPFAIAMNKQISGHVRRLQRRINILLYKDVKTRLLEFIKDLTTEYGKEKDGGLWIDHNLTQTDIAKFVGTSRKSTSLIMNELEQEGLIQFSRKHLFVVDPKELANQLAAKRQPNS